MIRKTKDDNDDESFFSLSLNHFYLITWLFNCFSFFLLFLLFLFFLSINIFSLFISPSLLLSIKKHSISFCAYLIKEKQILLELICLYFVSSFFYLHHYHPLVFLFPSSFPNQDFIRFAFHCLSCSNFTYSIIYIRIFFLLLLPLNIISFLSSFVFDFILSLCFLSSILFEYH